VDEHLDQILFFVHIGVEPKRVDDLYGEAGVCRDPHMLQETCAVVVDPEPGGVPQKDRVRPAAPSRHHCHICGGRYKPGNCGAVREREVGHDDEDGTV